MAKYARFKEGTVKVFSYFSNLKKIENLQKIKK